MKAKRTTQIEHADDYALTAREAALLLNVHVTTFRKRVFDGQLPAPFFPPGPPGQPMWWKSALTKKTNAAA
jgi:excisionase family DNA binding protein